MRRLMARVGRILVWPLRLLLRILAAIVFFGPRRLVRLVRDWWCRTQADGSAAGHRVAVARTWLAPGWRKAARWVVVAIGFIIYVALQYGTAHLISEQQWLYVFDIIVGCVFLALIIWRPPIAFGMWLILSPWVALFMRENVSHRLPVTFDRVAILVILTVLVFRGLAKRTPLRRLHLAEWLLLLAFFYIKIPGFIIMGEEEKFFAISRFSDGWALLLSPIFIYFATKWCITEKRHIVWIMVALVVMGCIWTGSAFYEHFTGHQWHKWFSGYEIGLTRQDIGAGRAAGPAQSQTVIGSVITLAILVLLHLSGWVKRLTPRVLLQLAVVPMFLGVFYSYTRISYIALVLAVFATVFLMRAGRRRYVIIFAVMVAAVLLQTGRLLEDRQFYNRMLNPRNYYVRMAMNVTAYNMIRDNLWFGVRDLPANIHRYVAPGHPLGIDYKGRRVYSVTDNEFLFVLAEQGVIGFILHFGALALLIVQVFRVRSSLPERGVLGKDFASTALAYVLVVLVDMQANQLQSLSYLYYLMFVMVAAVIRLSELMQEEAADRLPEGAADTDGDAAALAPVTSAGSPTAAWRSI